MLDQKLQEFHGNHVTHCFTYLVVADLISMETQLYINTLQLS